MGKSNKPHNSNEQGPETSRICQAKQGAFENDPFTVAFCFSHLWANFEFSCTFDRNFFTQKIYQK